ncbi:DUF4260 domain-containing protein [Isoptericola variabilis]|uniref:DUF4260 domain-containing protein n=1 Tax=Isoptericola variabilis (strain 225) TaxID=743718 RepID=F6FUR4_ISOV2|nr:DUF4260 domain-containing protein [Isoptericola variabilis]AEG43325.1 hypothetical protein Isova_0530 [Isoptericola variabilis 225]TWH35262.1 uncharacterized protein DUF4260 [Isoptericola variabilis J7]
MSDDARDEATQPLPQPTTDLTRPRVVLRAEALLVAVGLVWAAWLLVPATWWVLFAAFLLFDLSALGYLRGPRVGAIVYNLGHSYVGPLLLGALAVGLALGAGSASAQAFCATAALAWAFHVAVDRALGFGLKEPDSFHHTHLGMLPRRPTS